MEDLSSASQPCCFHPLDAQERKTLRSTPFSAANITKQDAQSTHLLQMVCGLPGFPILEAETVSLLAGVWDRLDFNKDGHLCREDFENALGTDVLWLDLLVLCDFSEEGHINQTSFVEGFTLFALDVPFQVEMMGTTTAMGMLKEVQRHANEQIKKEVAELSEYMTKRGVAGW
jgi:hypothetical protein